MDFEFSAEQQALQQEVRAYIASNLTPEIKAEFDETGYGLPLGGHSKAFVKGMVERGWTGMKWPRELGGQGRSAADHYVIEEEFIRAGLRLATGGSGDPAIMAFGTDEQKQRFIPASIRGELSFALGFSEPQCGADLAGIQCRAQRDGDDYVINGQKIFTTTAHVSSYLFLMARTDPGSKRQAGLSILLVPLHTPGITVRPLWTIQSDPPAPTTATYWDHRTNEVFFDNVRVPRTCLLGPENEGWTVAQRGLSLDRVGAHRYLISVHLDEDIVNWLKEEGESNERLRKDDVVRDTIAELWTEAQVCRLMTMRSLSMSSRGQDFSCMN